ncbi:hypothetical protein FQK02_06750 [Xanthomonas vasicola]|uniref:Membrane protein n=1 Tax=Xanthomonas vasicola pv. vasculorum NCPPB 890 TaxID=1184265 RepID=A0A836ZS34_XANVA|nr:hypothetical protein NX80_008525 [Xanthomonas vasicola pv. arecae]AZR35711.1 hypothetical protein NX08_015885 [Xanthomonas vasicola]KEZ97053.1 membrane protein [Xanthomonas vasicola pv. vasculorum NCPPB 895]KFA25749.1 membrane protein [Xanthomonas vasicola pv. vasculorum NCPPB 1326]KFA28603.1 membrane protein [Xanthomonas vasicola pv. vasculorum NCPPB 1381]
MFQTLPKLLPGCVLPIVRGSCIVMFRGDRLGRGILSAMLAMMLATRCILSAAGQPGRASSVLSAVLIGACTLLALRASTRHTARSSDQGHAP